MGDETKKAELAKQLLDEHYPKFLGFFDSVMKKNTEKNKSNWAVGTKMSLADLVIYEGTTTVSRNCPDLFKKYPVLVKHRQTVEALPAIKEYLAKRKECPPM